MTVVSVLDVKADRTLPRLDLTFLCRPAGPATGERSVKSVDREIAEAGFFATDALPGVLLSPQERLIQAGIEEITARSCRPR